MVRYVLEKYFQKRAYYVLNSNAGKEDGMDNPDARIEQDIGKCIQAVLDFCLGMLQLFQDLIVNLILIWNIMPFWTMYAAVYTTAGSTVAVWFAWRFFKLNYEIERKSADFRFSLINVRSQAEAIAFYGGEETEKTGILHRFEGILEFSVRTVLWQLCMSVWMLVYGEGLSLAPNLILTQRYFQGKIDFGGLGQTAGAYAGLSGSLSFLQNSAGGLATAGTALTRLGDMLERMEAITDFPDIAIEFTEEAVCELRTMSVRTPDNNRLLIKDISMKVGEGCASGKRLLVVGRSGVGKSSLLRSIGGLWTHGGGTVIRPKDCMFLPQQPYMPIGDLRTQCRYPDVGPKWDPWEHGGATPSKTSDWHIKHFSSRDEELMPYLELLGMEGMPARFEDGFESCEDWKRVLSLGEQQRLASIRAMIKRPKFVFLDEATSALSVKDEELIYQEFIRQGLCFISVGHRMSIAKFHDMVLEIDRDHKWKLMTVDEYKEQEDM